MEVHLDEMEGKPTWYLAGAGGCWVGRSDTYLSEARTFAVGAMCCSSIGSRGALVTSRLTRRIASFGLSMKEQPAGGRLRCSVQSRRILERVSREVRD